MQIAIVTGASSGLGREFVREIAKREKIDAIWVIARRENRLHELADGFSVPVVPVPLDLTEQKSFASLKTLLEEKSRISAFWSMRQGPVKWVTTQKSRNVTMTI